jgi:hypothetical protein
VGSKKVDMGLEFASLLAGSSPVVWVPADLAPPDSGRSHFLQLNVGGVEEVPAGVTIDPEGYTSDLLGAFEAGTSGDLGAPVFRRRLDLKGPAVLYFRDGRPAATEHTAKYEDSFLSHSHRVVALAFGPAPAWGDLASRAEFVVLINSLAEALGPKPASPSLTLVAAERPAPPAASSVAPPATDLTLWFVLALAAALVVEGLLAVSGPGRY